MANFESAVVDFKFFQHLLESVRTHGSIINKLEKQPQAEELQATEFKQAQFDVYRAVLCATSVIDNFTSSLKTQNQDQTSKIYDASMFFKQTQGFETTITDLRFIQRLFEEKQMNYENLHIMSQRYECSKDPNDLDIIDSIRAEDKELTSRLELAVSGCSNTFTKAVYSQLYQHADAVGMTVTLQNDPVSNQPSISLENAEQFEKLSRSASNSR